MRTQASVPTALLLCSLVLACGAEPEDGLEPDFDTQRSAYPPPPAEDTPQAYGMLRVANELDFDALDLDVALDARAATSIIEHRAGADEILGTADDQYLESVAELDSLFWLGPANMYWLLSYAQDEGYVLDVLPPPHCDLSLASSMKACIYSVEDAATPVSSSGGLGFAPTSSDLRSSCLDASDPAYPSADFFASEGLPGYLDPYLGHHGRLCVLEDEPVCDLGVAGLSWVSPACEAAIDVEPVLTQRFVDPATAASWAAGLAAAATGDTSYSLRVYEFVPGMTPTLLGDAMSHALADAPLEYAGPWLEREASDALPGVSASAQALLGDVIDDLGLTGAPFEVGTASEELPCPNCHQFNDAFVLLFRSSYTVVVLHRDTFWDS